MATIGSISVVFDADTGGLRKGVSDSIDSLESLRDSLLQVSEQMRALLSGVSKGDISLKVQSDTADIEKAADEVDAIAEEAEKSSPRISFVSDLSDIRKSANEVDNLAKKVEGSSPTLKAIVAPSEISSLSPPSADTSGASAGLQELGGEIEAVDTAANNSRSSLASLFVTSARIGSTVLAVSAAYRDFRSSLLENITAITGAQSAGDSLRVIQEALRGNSRALGVVIDATSSTFASYATSLLSIEGAQAALRNGVVAVAQAFGISDRAVLGSIEFFSQFITNQIATASTMRFSQRAAALLVDAYTSLGNSVGRFITESDRGAAAGRLIASGLDQLSSVAVRVNNIFELASRVVGRFAERFNIIGAVSATVGTAFDATVRAVSSLFSSTTSLSSVMGSLPAVVNSLASASSNVASGLLSAASASSAFMASLASRAMATASPVFSAIGTAAAAAGRTVGALAGAFSALVSSIGLVASATNEKLSFTEFVQAAARVAATTAAFGAAGGAVTALASGGTMLGGAITGAATAVSGFAALMPTTIALSAAAAVATGRFSHEILNLALNAQSIDQMAYRFGTSTQEMTKLKMAAANTNVGMGQLVKGQQNFYSNLSKIKAGQINLESVREAKMAFDKLEVSLDDLKSRRPEEVFKLVSQKIGEIKDPADRTRVAMDLFGRQGANIIPALREFAELEMDFKRVGGALNDIDFARFNTAETSFDRIHAAADSLGQTMMLPFVELQKGLNNMKADMLGGMTAALMPIAGMIADITKPFAVVLEVVGRVVNIMLRLVGAAATIVTAAAGFSVVADLAGAAGKVILDLLSYIETLVSYVESAASSFASFMRPAMQAFEQFGDAVLRVIEIFAGDIFGDTYSSTRAVATSIVALGAAYAVATFGSTAFSLAMQSTAVRAVVAAVATQAAWVTAIAVSLIPVITAGIVAIGALAASMIATAATAAATSAVMAASWLVALGPIGLVILGVTAIGASLAALYAIGGGITSFFSSFFSGSEQIDAAKASAEELAATVEKNSKSGFQKDMEAVAGPVSQESQTVQVDFGEGARTAQAGYEKARTAIVQFGMSFGLTEEQAKAAVDSIRSDAAAMAESLRGPSKDEIMTSIQDARDRMGELTIDAAKFGQTGADAASKAQEDFIKLQQEFSKGGMTLEQFDEQAARLAESLEENLELMRSDSPEVTLKKNLELYKQLDEAVKSAGKSVRDIAAGTVVDGKLFPTSEKVKANAEKYKNEYAAALDAIKRKLQAGGFADELNAKRENLKSEFDSGNISKEEFETKKLELDTTSAQEQASIAAEEVKREFDRNFKQLGEDVSFAENIRKELETAFLSPVQKFEKELKKIKENESLDAGERDLAEKNLRKNTRENLVGKTAQDQLQDRNRDVRQAAEAGLINPDELNAELKKASEDLAAAVGVAKTPFETFSSSLDNIAKQFGFAGQPIDVVREKLKDNAEQLAMFDRALEESRDALLSSLGIEKTPQQVFDDQIKKIDEAVNATDPTKRITATEAAQARAAATRKRDADLGAGEDLGGQFRDRQSKIDEAFGDGKDPAKFAAARNKLAMDRRSAAGLDETPAQALKAGVDKVNDAFGVTGKSMAEIKASLSADDFKEYQEALKKNSDAVKANLGVEKSGAEKLSDARTKLEKAVQDGVITESEKNKAVKEQRDSFLASLGIPKSPAQDFEDAVKKIKENASELNPEEMAKGLKEAKDKLLSSLGIDKSPAQSAAESMKKLREAFDKGQISAEEFAKGSQKAKDSLLQSLGIPLDPVTQLRERLNDLGEAFTKGLISQEEFTRGQDEAKRSMLPGGEEESPVKKFQRDIKSVEQAASEGLITPEELAQRKLNLQAQLQEDLKPSLDFTQADRRGIEGSDVRSKSGVDTFFRILRGNDNPSLKAQLEVARNTRILAEASKNPDAAPVIAQLPAR